MDNTTTSPAILHLVPLIQALPKLSWDNLVGTHDRWHEEVSALCVLAGNGVYASLQSSTHPHSQMDNNGHIRSSTRKGKEKENRKKKNVMKEYTPYDDHIARAIIILCMNRDIRERFARFIRVASTAKQLFNGIAILKEAVAEGQAREREAGGLIPESELHEIRSKALAMAEEMDWSSINSESRKDNQGSGVILFRFIRWRKHRKAGEREEREYY